MSTSELELHHPGLQGLSRESRLILEGELQAGNQIAGVETDDETGGLAVVLAQPFHDLYESVARTTRYNELGRPGHWKAHFVHIPTGQIIACTPSAAAAGHK